jgi:predicted esterase
MTQALYAHMNNKTIKKKRRGISRVVGIGFSQGAPARAVQGAEDIAMNKTQTQ